MKKTYIAPSMEILETNTQNFLAASSPMMLIDNTRNATHNRDEIWLDEDSGDAW